MLPSPNSSRWAEIHSPHPGGRQDQEAPQPTGCNCEVKAPQLLTTRLCSSHTEYPMKIRDPGRPPLLQSQRPSSSQKTTSLETSDPGVATSGWGTKQAEWLPSLPASISQIPFLPLLPFSNVVQFHQVTDGCLRTVFRFFLNIKINHMDLKYTSSKQWHFGFLSKCSIKGEAVLRLHI